MAPTNPFPLSREFRLLAACSGPHVHLITEEIDWPNFLALVRRHQVQGLVHRALRVGAGAPAELHAMAATSSAKALGQAAELVRLARAFTEAGLEMAALKGVMLSWQLYDDPGVRHAGDLDLMIHAEDLLRADSLLRDAGYEAAVGAAALGVLREHGYEVSYRHVSKRISIDLHWAQDLWTEAQLRELWEHCRITEKGGVPLRHLAGDALMLYLCDHGSKHQWSRLKWLSDVATLLAAPRSAPWGALQALAERWDLTAALGEAALLVHWVYGLPVPPGLKNLTEVSAGAASQSMMALLGEHEDRRIGAVLALRRAAHRRTELRWRAYLRRLLPQAEDMQRFPLPAALTWLYYPLRPMFWCWRRFC